MAILLRFSTTNDIGSAVIRWRTDSDISHVEYWDTSTGVTLGARFSFKAENDGVLFRPLGENAKQRNVILATFEGIVRAHEWTRCNLLGKPYDWKAIFGIARGDASEHDINARFCSEAITESALIGAGVRLLACEPWNATPRDVLISPCITRVSG